MDHSHAHDHAHGHAGHSHGAVGEPSSTANWMFRIAIALVVIALLTAYSVYFPVVEGSAVVISRLGNPVREILQTGPHFKWPYPIEQTLYVDMRKKVFDTTFTPTFTHDKRSVMLETFVVWRVKEPLKFIQSLGSDDKAEEKLDSIVTARKNYYLGQYDLTALVSTNPKDLKTQEIEDLIVKDATDEASKKFGIVVEQVGFKRIAYPEQNVKTVLANMRAERKAEAGKIRAEGEKVAQGIRDDARVRREEILKDGREQAGKIRGEAEKEAAKVYAKAHSLDPDFYRFWRSLEALKKSLGSKTTIFLRTDEGFFNVLKPPTEEPTKTKRNPKKSSRRVEKKK